MLRVSHICSDSCASSVLWHIRMFWSRLHTTHVFPGKRQRDCSWRELVFFVCRSPDNYRDGIIQTISAGPCHCHLPVIKHNFTNFWRNRFASKIKLEIRIYLIPIFSHRQTRPYRSFQVCEGDCVGNGQEHRLQETKQVSLLVRSKRKLKVVKVSKLLLDFWWCLYDI